MARQIGLILIVLLLAISSEALVDCHWSELAARKDTYSGSARQAVEALHNWHYLEYIAIGFWAASTMLLALVYWNFDGRSNGFRQFGGEMLTVLFGCSLFAIAGLCFADFVYDMLGYMYESQSDEYVPWLVGFIPAMVIDGLCYVPLGFSIYLNPPGGWWSDTKTEWL